MRVNTNVAAHNTWRQMYRVNANLSSSLEKLSSGLRINSAADDAGGLAISEGMRAQIRGLAQAEKNAQDGLALINTAEAALDEVHEMLQRGRELAVQGSSATLQNQQRDGMQAEIIEIQNEIDRIGQVLEFNSVPVFSGGTIDIQVGANDTANDRITVALANLDQATIGASGDISAADVRGVALSQGTITIFNDAIDSLSLLRSQLGAQANRMEHTINTVQTARENIMAAESRIRDVDMADEMTNLTKNQILVQSATAMMAQANARPMSVLALLQ